MGSHLTGRLRCPHRFDMPAEVGWQRQYASKNYGSSIGWHATVRLEPYLRLLNWNLRTDTLGVLGDRRLPARRLSVQALRKRSIYRGDCACTDVAFQAW